MRGQTTYTFKRIEKKLRKCRQRDETLPYCAACGEELGKIVYRNKFYDPLCRVCFETPDIRDIDYCEKRHETKTEPVEIVKVVSPAKCPIFDFCKHASNKSKTCNSTRKAHLKCMYF